MTEGSLVGEKSPRIESLVDAIFGASSLEEEEGERKGTKCGKSLGSEMGFEEPSVSVEVDMVGPTRSYSDEMDEEVNFFVRHLVAATYARRMLRS
jgi:hypothetical protein